jgi:ABC-type phosphate transport system substrate-binding protein
MQTVKLTRSLKGLGVLGTAGALSLTLLAGSAHAAQPGGVACQATDGKISGRGATFAKQAWQLFITSYRDDVCGAVADVSGTASLKNSRPDDPAGTSMLAYNYTNSQTGSGQGRTSQLCRTDAWGGSDGPYSNSQLTSMNGAPSPAASCPSAFGSTVSPFLQGPFPNVGDATANIMSFPIAGSANVVAVNLTGAACPGGPAPVTLQFTAAMVDGLFDGRILTWSDPVLRAGGLNANLANCTTPVLRRVRSDDSGTTQIQKNYLAKVDPNSPGCDGLATTSWLTLRNAAAPNNAWPNLPQAASGSAGVPSSAAATATCSAISSHDGNPGVAGAVNTTSGAVGYIDVADATTLAPNAIQAAVRNQTDTAFIDPATGTTANCNFTPVQAPPGINGAVGLAAGDTWSNNNAGLVRSDVTNDGPGYPICGMTFALVFTGLSGAPGGTAISGLTNNQRRTLYSFMSYVLSNVAQDKLTSAFYQRLPGGLANTIRRGFQANF